MKKILCLTSHDLNAPAYGAVLRARNIFKMLSHLGQVRVVLAGQHKNVIEHAKAPQADFELLDKVYFQPTRYSAATRARPVDELTRPPRLSPRRASCDAQRHPGRAGGAVSPVRRQRVYSFSSSLARTAAS